MKMLINTEFISLGSKENLLQKLLWHDTEQSKYEYQSKRKVKRNINYLWIYFVEKCKMPLHKIMWVVIL